MSIISTIESNSTVYQKKFVFNFYCEKMKKKIKTIKWLEK